MSSIQQGIQAAHCQMELFLKYREETGEGYGKGYPKYNMLHDWAENHKTMICLNGGMLEDMKEFWIFLKNDDNPFPYAKFHEAEEAMGRMLTNIAIVLPERIYTIGSLVRRGVCTFESNNLTVNPTVIGLPPSVTKEELELINTIDKKFTDFEVELITKLNCYSLAK